MKMRASHVFLILLVSIYFLNIPAALAAVPGTISYQSRLRDNTEVPITAATTIQFSIYNHLTNGASTDAASSAGPLLWKETYDGAPGCTQITPDAAGYFAVQLGSCLNFPSYITFDEPLYLGVKIGADAEAAPRVLLGTHPYAMNAARVGSFVDTGANALQGQKTGDSTAGVQGQASSQLLLQGSGWNGGAAVDLEMKLQNVVTDANNYRFAVLNNADSEVFGVDESGAAIVAGNITINNTSNTVAVDMTRASSGQWISMTDGTDDFGVYNNAGTPEGVLAANIGSLSVDTANGVVYVKTTDTVNTGWDALVTSGSIDNIYTSDGALTGERSITGDATFGLSFDKMTRFYINGSGAFPGATYALDYSANYTDRSLVDKEYVDNSIASGNIYGTDGTFTGDRVATSNGNEITFTGSGGNGWIFEANDAPDSSFFNMHADEMEFSTANGISSAGMIFNTGGTSLNYQNGGGSTSFNVGTNIVFSDSINSRGAVYGGDYEANFLPRSLVTKQYVDSKVGSSIFDTDADTGIQVEANADEDMVRISTAGTERFLIDNQGRMRLANNPSAGGRDSLFEVGSGSESSTFAVQADPAYGNIATFRDQDGENVFKANGSMANNDLYVSFGDIDDAFGAVSMDVNQSDAAINIESGSLRFLADHNGGTNAVGFRSPAGVLAEQIWALPNADGAANEALVTDGAGNLSWGTVPTNVTASNGLTKVTNDIQLGGALTKNTTIDFTGDEYELYFVSPPNNSRTTVDGWAFATTDLGTNESLSYTPVDIKFVNAAGDRTFFRNNATNIGIDSNNAVFEGLSYDVDYSANYTNRSLVDKEYVDDEILASAPTLYLQDGTLTGNRILDGNSNSLTMNNLGGFYTTVINGNETTNITMDADVLSLQAQDIGTGTSASLGFNDVGSLDFTIYDGANNSGISVNSSQILIADGVNSRGAEYSADYSANYTDRSLVDKEYVDGSISASYLADNGIINNAGTHELGGSLNKNTNIDLNTFGLQFDSSNGYFKTTDDRTEFAYGDTYFTGEEAGFEIEAADANSATNIYIRPDQFEFSNYDVNTGLPVPTFHGLTYDTDYSANYINRSLVDKEYVDDAIANNVVAANGLTNNAGTIELGGALTKNTTIWRNAGTQLSFSGTGARTTMSDTQVQTYVNNAGGNNGFFISDTGSGLYHGNNGTGIDTKLLLGDNSAIISSRAGFSGLEYNTDYSANYTNRSLVDKEYVDGLNISMWDLDADTGIQVEEGADDDIIRFDTAGSERMAILANGNIGVGTADPSEDFTLYGDNIDMEFESSVHNSGTHTIYFKHGNNQATGRTYIRSSASGASSNSNLSFYTADSNRFEILASGQIRSNVEHYLSGNARLGSAVNSGVKYLRFSPSESKAAIFSVPAGSYGRADLRFTVGDNSSPAEKTENEYSMIIARDGDVGIGNAITPSTKLHVHSGAANTTGILTLENTAGDMQMFRTDATPEASVTGSIGDLAVDGTNGDLYIKETGTATNTGWVEVGSGGTPTAIWDADSDTGIQVEEGADDDILRFDTAGTEFFTMDNGRLSVLNTGNSVFIGEGAGNSDDLTDNRNVFIGKESGMQTSSGFYNTATGYFALKWNTTGDNNTAFGYSTLENNTGDNNTALGYNALVRNTSGSSNIAVGYDAGAYDSGLASNQTSTNSVYLGYQTMSSASGNTNEIVIGHTASGGGSNSVVLGNDSITTTLLKGKVGIGTTGPKNVLDVEGAVAVGATYSGTDTAPANGMIIEGKVAIGANNAINGGLFVVDGVTIGSDSTDNLIDEATNGSSSSTLYIGNRTIDTSASDMRVKDIIGNTSLGLEDLMKLKVVDFTWKEDFDKDNTTVNTGLIAQDVYAQLPYLAKRPENEETGLWTVKYNYLAALAVRGIQEQQDMLLPIGTGIIIDENFSGEFMHVTHKGNVGIGIENAAHKLEVAGDVGAQGFINLSSESSKTNIEFLQDSDYSDFLVKLNDTDVATYRYKECAGDQVCQERLGLIAEKAPTEILSEDRRGVDIYKMTSFLFGATKAQQTAIQSLQFGVEELQPQERNQGDLNMDALSVDQDSRDLTLVFKKHATFSSDSVGRAKILEGETEVRINFEEEYEYQPVVTATLATNSEASYFVDKVDTEGFSIKINKQQNEDIIFNWHAFAAEDGKLTVSDGVIEDIQIIRKTEQDQEQEEPQDEQPQQDQQPEPEQEPVQQPKQQQEPTEDQGPQPGDPVPQPGPQPGDPVPQG